MKNFIFLFITLCNVLIFSKCATRGIIEGGSKDTIPPVVIRSSPKENTVFFKDDKILLNFDEFIKLSDISNQLVISPPLEKKYFEIKPRLGASKKIEIKLLKKLDDNTTYTFNFGKSIEDFNEGNLLPFYSYAISTGERIDSLKYNGTVEDALNKNKEDSILVYLYTVDSIYNDSTIFLKKPYYITQTLDSTNFEFKNLKPGKYEIIAIKDEGSNYLFDQNTDKVGFVKDFINIPIDTFSKLRLFKEKTNFAWGRPKYINENKIEFPFYGDLTNQKIILDSNFDKIKYIINKNREKDTLNFWFKDNEKIDSIVFNLKGSDSIEKVVVKKRKTQIKDSLILKGLNSNFLELNDSIKIKSNIPIINVNTDSIKIIDIDSLLIPFNISLDKNLDIINLKINPLPNDNYKIDINPGAITDFFGNSNEPLIINLKTKAYEEYGTLFLQVDNNINVPYFIEIINFKGEKIRKELGDKIDGNYSFFNLLPDKYTVRIIIDENNNFEWDTGNYLKKIQPERVIYLTNELDLRANWELNESIEIK
tara:strand:+ start:98099 stop:99706 length:1608 start_codon:yes stop_codon:yes gene_type:complete